MEDVYILAFETSCDDTSVAIVKNGNTVIANAISSQIDVHAIYGGVVPEIASRKHIEQIDIVLDAALKEANMSIDQMDAVAVTNAPGLIGALLVGVSYAKALAFSLNKPLIAVHHIEGHIYANFLDNEGFNPPFACLVVSGGHTHIALVEDYCKLEILGGTHDDAAGEVFDKVARALGLGYPGGPQIDNLAKTGNMDAIPFPRAFFGDNSLDFSFSGLKSAVLSYLNKSKMTGDAISIPDVCACFQKAVTDVLVVKTVKAAQKYGITKIAMAGGVCCNSFLRSRMSDECTKNGLELNIPKPVYCTDNAAMIGARAYYDYINKSFADLSLNACATKDLRRL